MLNTFWDKEAITSLLGVILFYYLASRSPKDTHEGIAAFIVLGFLASFIGLVVGILALIWA